MENPYEAREKSVVAGVCPDCGAKLEGITAAQYNEQAIETTGGRFLQCTAEYTLDMKKAGKQPCTFKAFLLDPPKQQETSGSGEEDPT